MDAPADLYPSRSASKPRFLERRDPVLRGRPGVRAPLSPGQRAAYERDGFVTLNEFFRPDELASFRDELERLCRDDAIVGGETVIAEPGGDEVRSIFKVHVLSPIFGALARDPRLIALAEYILGDRVYVHQSRLNYKPGFCGKEFYWHSDFETWHVEDGMPRMRALSVSIALTENTEQNGPLLLIPGSHRHYVACVGETPEEHYKDSLRRQEYGVPDEESLKRLAAEGGIQAVTGPAGSATLFDCNTMHGSNSNITPDGRANVFLVYNAVSNRLRAPFGAKTPRPHFIAERDDTGPIRQSPRKSN